MKAQVLLVLLVLATAIQARSQAKKTPPPVEKLCGKLMHVEQVPVKKVPNNFEEKTKNLAHVSVRLYHADGDRPCCAGLSLAAETTTGRWGSFHMKEEGLAAGLYWVVVRPDIHEHMLLIQYYPKKESAELCSENLYQLDDTGRFWRAEFITVD